MSADAASSADTPPCLFCGEPQRIEIFEIWSSHEFMLEACCEDLHETVVREMAGDPAWARALLKRIGVEAFTGHKLRRLADDGGCGLLLDWQLELRISALPARGGSSTATTPIAPRRSRGGSAKPAGTGPQ